MNDSWKDSAPDSIMAVLEDWFWFDSRSGGERLGMPNRLAQQPLSLSGVGGCFFLHRERKHMSNPGIESGRIFYVDGERCRIKYLSDLDSQWKRWAVYFPVGKTGYLTERDWSRTEVAWRPYVLAYIRRTKPVLGYRGLI